MPNEYLTEGELGFFALNSRDNPATLKEGTVTKSVNMRLEKGVATTRKGLKKFYDASLAGKKVVGVGSYVSQTGQESIVLLADDPVLQVTRIVSFETNTGNFFNGPQLPARITSDEGVEIVHGLNAIFITRGHTLRPLRWDLTNNIPIEIPLNDNFPNCTGLMYFQNRFIATGKHNSMTDVARRRDTVCVSHFLEYDGWSASDAFTINQGSNDEVITTVPWTLNEFIILCRNSTFYLNVGTHRYAQGEALAADARLDTLAVDVGCAAKKSAVQIGDAVIFLSDNGVYAMTPTTAGKPDGVKLLTLSDPLSSPIDDVIQKINKDYISKSVAAYWNNRYYLAVPINGDPVEKVQYTATIANGNTIITVTSANHGLSVGDFVITSLSKKSNYDGTFAITATPDNNTFSYTVLGSLTPISGTLTYFKESRLNNAILVFNFILKSWESVDTYPTSIDFLGFSAGKKDKQRRLFAIDENEGILLLEESPLDELGDKTGTPILGTESARLSWTLATDLFADGQPVQGELITRRFTSSDGKDKRYSSIETDMYLPAGAIVETYAITTNTDTQTLIDSFQWTKESDDTTRRNPVRKTAYGLQIKFKTLRLQPSIRSNYVKFTVSGKNNMNSK